MSGCLKLHELLLACLRLCSSTECWTWHSKHLYYRVLLELADNQVRMIDVLIIGGGPHALTLASLLSTPPPDPQPADDSAPSRQDLLRQDLDPRPRPPRGQTQPRGRRVKRKAPASMATVMNL
ncbi:unnamed protein product [Arctogadus glacialis]